MKTNSLKLILASLVMLAIGTVSAPDDKDKSQFEKYKETFQCLFDVSKNSFVQLPQSGKAQESRDFMRNSMLCVVAGNALSKNNSLLRMSIATASSLIGSLILTTSYDNVPGCDFSDCFDKSGSSSSSSDPKGAVEHYTFLVWTMYFIGQNVPQFFDFLKDATYRKNFIKAIWDTICANRDRREWASIFVRNFGALFMHYTPAGQSFSNALPELPDFASAPDDDGAVA